MLLKLKFMHIAPTLDIANNGPDTITFKPEDMLEILDLRSLAYYKIKQGTQQQNLRKYSKFKRVDTLCKHFNKFLNTLKKERELEESKENYP